MDLTLIKFIFNAFQEATDGLGIQQKVKEILTNINVLLYTFPDYPTEQTPDNKVVLVAVPGEHSQMVYNVPNALATVFPGEDIGNRTPGTHFGTYYWTGPEEIVTDNLEGDDSRIIMDRVIPYIDEQADKENPFFAVVWFHTPHLPVLTGE